jgi:hypothetical protein
MIPRPVRQLVGAVSRVTLQTKPWLRQRLDEAYGSAAASVEVWP